MQLHLFAWDRIAVGTGYEKMAAFAFHEARRSFSRVLEVMPEHPDAVCGMRDLEFWEGIFRKMDGMALDAAVPFLWARINEFPFMNSEGARTLRSNLLRRLLLLLADLPAFYLPPDLCGGYLSLQLGDYAAAERHLRPLLERLPENGRLYGYLGDTLWMQGRYEAAGAAYATALLLAPHKVAVEAMRHKPLADLIEEYGPALAPIHGFLTNLLPLVNPPAKPSTREAMAYDFLRQAEEARRLGNHEAMVAARSELKAIAPEILRDYLDGLE